MSASVDIIFWTAIFLNLLGFLLVLLFLRKEGFHGYLSRAMFFTGLATLVFGIHHFLEILLHDSRNVAIAEAVEGVAAVLLVLAVYNIYRLVEG